MKRIVVIGTSCSGKTTLARQLAQKLNLPHIEIDSLHWGPNWTVHEDFDDRVDRATQRGAWVMDGNYTRIRIYTWSRADTIVWLDYPARVVGLRALRRTIVRAWRRTELWNGNRESFRLSFFDRESVLLWVWRTWRIRRRDTPKLLRRPEYATKQIVRLRHPREAERWFAAVLPRIETLATA